MNKSGKIMTGMLSAMVAMTITSCILREQAINRANTFVEVVYNGVPRVLNAEEFIDYSKDKNNYFVVEDYDICDNVCVDSDDDASPNLRFIGNFLLTGYCDCEICQEEWVGTTAIGVTPSENNTIAVDPDVIPLGSYVWINGVRYHAEDVGGMINDNHIDIFCGSHEECYSEFCNGYADVYLEVE